MFWRHSRQSLLDYPHNFILLGLPFAMRFSMSCQLVWGALILLLCTTCLSGEPVDDSESACMAAYSSINCTAALDAEGSEADFSGCGCVSFGTSSRKLECTHTSTGQSLLSYSSADCTGTPTTTSLEDSEGCIDFGATGGMLFTCNYTESNADDEGVCFTITEGVCGDCVVSGPQQEDYGAILDGCGCLDDGEDSYQVFCDDEVPTFNVWPNTECSGDPVTSLSLESHCLDTNLTILHTCQSVRDCDINAASGLTVASSVLMLMTVLVPSVFASM
eukprot:m.50358 g.50358  ORF g.50358 m.50358 type:complete len:275 (-) comp13412_c0_seq11:374-1198(-)